MNLKINENPSKDELNYVLSIVESIYQNSARKSFFNWPFEKAREELSQARVWVGCADSGDVLGFLSFRDLGEAFEITVLGTRPEAQKKGVQTQILKYFQTFAAKRNKLIWLEVNAENQAALSLYKHCGFQTQRRRKSYYPDGADAFEMAWAGEC